MSNRSAGILCFVFLSSAFHLATAQSQEEFTAPKVWDEAKLKDWGLPVGPEHIKPKYLTAKQYYGAPVDNLRTYPVFHPDKEPAGYWEELHRKEPLQLVETGKPRTRDEWVTLGRRVFEEMDNAAVRTADDQAIDFLRSRDALKEHETTVADNGVIPGFRWVVEAKGKVSLGLGECTGCHVRVDEKGAAIYAGPGNLKGGGVALDTLLGGFRKRYYSKRTITAGEEAYYDFHVPWIENDVHARLRSMDDEQLGEVFSSLIPGVFPRVNGSPYWPTKAVDLRGIKNRRYLDHTGTHRNNEPADIARYAALVVYADISTFGDLQTLPDDHPRPAFRVPDDALFAIGMYLYSLETLRNPQADGFDKAIVARGKQIFESENCSRCHSGGSFGGDMLTPAAGFEIPDEYYDQFGIIDESAETDSKLAMNTRKGTGMYKVPSLRGLWYRGLFGHSGSCSSLEDWFDPARLEDDYVPTGWKGLGVTNRAVRGHVYGLDLSRQDKLALITYLKTL